MFVVLGRLLDSIGLGDAGASFLHPVVLLGRVREEGNAPCREPGTADGDLEHVSAVAFPHPSPIACGGI